MRIAFAAALFAASIATVAAADFPLGRWYTEGTEHEVYTQLLIDSSGDKSFTKNGAYVIDCQHIQRTTENGTWTFDGKRLVEVTTSVDGQALDPNDPSGTDSFDVSMTDADHATLFDPKTGVHWSLARTTQTTLPPPANCTT
jgi:hypothetical protein